ncbi:MAG: helix-turn-helix domain-containing protein [Clostridia bacterium]|nr:helix-turn-helix domain-containing protein [Clostridia bacterium]
MKTYVDRIRELREDHDLKQKDVAELLGTTQQVYSRYEKGLNEIPIHHLITLARFYKVSTDYILCLTNQTSPYPLMKNL